LGARKGRLLASVVVDGLRLTGTGAAFGLAVAWLAGPYAQDLLVGMSPRDPRVLLGVVGALLLVAAAAGAVPALRATRVDATTALRSE
jgi:ABC-type antimicrobial peptide transport system permease subunit